MNGLKDSLKRPMHDLRISVTDRCNFRCVYCMPKDVFGKEYPFLPKDALLSFEEIFRLVRALMPLGIRKVRLTGGEPLMRKGVEELVAMLAQIDGLEISMTTNGSLLVDTAQKLKRAGLQRVTVSLDALDDAIFKQMNGVELPVARVLDGIKAAKEAGLSPLKINMVVKRGLNDAQILPMARAFRWEGMIVRFIEYMDVGNSNGWQTGDVVPAKEILERIHAVFPLEPIEANYRGEVAKRWRYQDGGGEIGLIASVTQPFCGDCTRLRLSADGQLFTCLFATKGHNLREILRPAISDAQIAKVVSGIWSARADRYSEVRGSQPQQGKKVEMSYIGG